MELSPDRPLCRAQWVCSGCLDQCRIVKLSTAPSSDNHVRILRAPHFGVELLVSTQPLVANLLLNGVHAIPSCPSMLCYVTKHSRMHGRRCLVGCQATVSVGFCFARSAPEEPEGRSHVQQMPSLWPSRALWSVPDRCIEGRPTGGAKVGAVGRRGIFAFAENPSVAAILGPRAYEVRGTTTGRRKIWTLPSGRRPSRDSCRRCAHSCAKRASEVSELLRPLSGATEATRTRCARS
jgi:hypothetical protein